jgi:hypothetical protein
VTVDGRVVPAPAGAARRGRAEPPPRVALVDLLDRLLAGGVVISGDLTLSIADVDLVHISLRVLIASASGQDVLRPLDRIGEPPRDMTAWGPAGHD